MIDNYEENPNTSRGFDIGKEVQPHNDVNIHHNENAKVLGGYMNECDGEYSIVLGGQYNECTSDYSVVIGGSDNQCHEPYSVVMGTQGIGAHSNTLLWNGSVNRSVMTTMASQCMLVSDNGLLFSTPKCSAILNSHIPEGMACVCWDPEELDAEIADGNWHVIPANVDDVFSSATDMWSGIIRRATNSSLVKWIGLPDANTVGELN